MNSDHVHTHPISDVLRVLAGQDDSPTHLDRIQMRLDESRRVDLESATVIIASWENRFAAAGGVRAVTREYAAHLTSANRKVRVLTPLHTGLGTPPGPIQLVSVLWHDFEGVRRRVEVLEANWAGVRWVYVHSEGFFCADGGRDRSNPYIYASDDTGPANTSPQLVRDCLFYATVAPKVLGALHLVDNLVIHLQDWETAGVALSVKSAVLRKDIAHAISILVLHNPYDKPLGSDGWAKLTDLPEPRDTPATFLGRMLPFVDAPPATVSREFAADLVGDPLQTACLADHLQRQFACCKPIGVDNGPFETVAPAFSVAAINDARNGMPSAILAEKQMHRNAMKRKMAEDQPAGRWGNVDFESLEDDVPVFMCVGRLDPGQKGFDVVARAIETALRGGFNARFVLAPILGSAPQPFIDDLEALGLMFSGRVVVYPFRMEEGYFETQRGSTFSIWPSMYEPFGGVSEFLLRGTPVIARSTGGLRQQVVTFDPSTGLGNGILYKAGTPDDIAAGPAGDEWRSLLAEPIPANRNQPKYPAYLDQVEKLVGSIKTAMGLFQDAQAYGRLLSNAPGSVDGYSWERAASEYASLYETARRADLLVAQRVG